MSQVSTRPNFIFLQAEDAGYHLGCTGDEYAHTPYLDQLAEKGTLFTNTYACCPVCAPSRSSTVTGCYPTSIGTHHMRCLLRHPPRVFTQELKSSGYHVDWATKTDFNFDPPEDFRTCASEWWNDLKDGTLPEPFFTYRNFGVTHESTMWTEVNDDGFGMFQERLRFDHVLTEEGRHDPAHANVPGYLPDTDAVRMDISRYHDALTIHDHQIGEVLEALAESPYAENTVVIYLSDHGRGLVREKRFCYDAGLHVPLIITIPGQDQPLIDDSLVSTVDIAPTILSLAGIEKPDHYQGINILSPEESHQYIFSARDRMDEAFDKVRTVRTKKYRYIRNDCPDLSHAQIIRFMEQQATTIELRKMHAEDPEGTAKTFDWVSPEKAAEELYDCEVDPDNIYNLATCPDYNEILKQHRAMLVTHTEAVGDKGEISERDLIAQGVIENSLDRYIARTAYKKEAFRISPFFPVSERDWKSL